eukprot:5401875-Prymnesium_polylepis.2
MGPRDAPESSSRPERKSTRAVVVVHSGSLQCPSTACCFVYVICYGLAAPGSSPCSQADRQAGRASKGQGITRARAPSGQGVEWAGRRAGRASSGQGPGR